MPDPCRAPRSSATSPERPFTVNVQAELGLSGDPGPSVPAALKVHLFGTMRAEDAAGGSVLPRVRKTRGLLAVLALHAPRPVSRAQLIALLWSRREPEQGRASLRQALHELQAAFGALALDLLHAGRHEIALRDSGLWVDARALLRADGGAGAALDLFRPDLLVDLAGIDPAFERWVDSERQRLLRRATALARQVLAEGNDPAGAERAAELLVRLDPTDEAAWQWLLRFHAARGDQAGARAVAARCQAALTAAGGRAPSPATAAVIVGVRGPLPPLPDAGPHAPAARADVFPPPPDLLPPEPQVRPHDHPGGSRRASARRAGATRIGVNLLRALAAPGAATAAVTAIAAGLSEELVAALARFRSLSCVPLAALGAPLPVAAGHDQGPLWRHLGLDFLLDGTVRGDGTQLRVSLRLLDLGAGGEVIWSSRFDRPLEHLLALQDEIAGAAVAQLETRLLLWQTDRARHHPDPEALRLLHLALPALFRLDRAAFAEAGQLLEHSRRLDPNHAATHTWLAHWQLFALGQGWAADPGQAQERVRALADEAVALDPEDARGLALAAHVRGFVGHDPIGAAALHERAVAANASLPLGWCLSGLNHAYLGDHDEAIRRTRLARDLSPHDPLGYVFDMALSVAYLLSGAPEAAVRVGRAAIACNPGFSSAYKAQLSALGQLGRHEEAADIRGRLLALEPGFSLTEALERCPIVNEEGRARYIDGLSRGGLV